MPEYDDFDRQRWAATRPGVAPDFSETQAGEVGPADLREIYGPLAAFVERRAAGASSAFVVSIIGSVAVGKSTSARALRAMLELGPPTRSVDVVSTDGFLYPNRVLAARGLTDRKGFPQTFDHDAFSRFLRAVKGGAPEVRAPAYSHVIYDLVEGDAQIVRAPEVLIVEGMPLGADLVDLSVYVDADEADIEQWYVQRFRALCREAIEDEASFFRPMAGCSDAQVVALAHDVWASINRVNLYEHILPERDRCQVILEKQADHTVRRVRVRTGDVPR